MTIKDRVEAFIEEAKKQAQQNYKDAQGDMDHHARGFADAQMWAVKRLEKILKQHGRNR